MTSQALLEAKIGFCLEFISWCFKGSERRDSHRAMYGDCIGISIRIHSPLSLCAAISLGLGRELGLASAAANRHET